MACVFPAVTKGKCRRDETSTKSDRKVLRELSEGIELLLTSQTSRDRHVVMIGIVLQLPHRAGDKRTTWLPSEPKQPGTRLIKIRAMRSRVGLIEDEDARLENRDGKDGNGNQAMIDEVWWRKRDRDATAARDICRNCGAIWHSRTHEPWESNSKNSSYPCLTDRLNCVKKEQ